MPTTVMITMVALELDDEEDVGGEGEEDEEVDANGAGGGSISRKRPPSQDIKAIQEQLRAGTCTGRKQSL